MPGPLVTRDELDNLTPPPDKKMRRDLEAVYRLLVGVL